MDTWIIIGIAVLLAVVVFAILKKLAKVIIIIAIVAVIALAIFGVTSQNKPFRDLTPQEWQQITIEQYNKYKEEIESNPEIQAIYDKMVETAKDATDKAKKKALEGLIKELEKLAGDEN